LRAIALMLPEKEWDDGKLMYSSHQTVINDAVSFVASFNKNISKELLRESTRLKGARELISYHAPTSGDWHFLKNPTATDFRVLVAEVAQFSSELLEVSIKKNADPSSFVFLESYADQLFLMPIGDATVSDDDDGFRLSYIQRKQPAPRNLQRTLSEGHIEDFFGSWCAQEPQQGEFNPDDGWDILFDLG
jgi:hypothetical protein